MSADPEVPRPSLKVTALALLLMWLGVDASRVLSWVARRTLKGSALQTWREFERQDR